MSTYQLVPFHIFEARLVASWLLDADDTARFTGERRYPVEPGEVAMWAQEASSAHLLLVDGEAAAYGEIIEDDADGDIEIGRLVIAPERRSQPTGRILVAHLCEMVRLDYPYDEVWLRVGREYEADLSNGIVNGFVEAPECSGPNFIWLRKQLCH
ncbi:MAG: hypothetical protein P4L33_06735 [Capsulimonadaceae bacterium]|nr:hypothetical protein [Capsulimonadaceae bacterium]